MNQYVPLSTFSFANAERIGNTENPIRTSVKDALVNLRKKNIDAARDDFEFAAACARRDPEMLANAVKPQLWRLLAQRVGMVDTLKP